MKQNIVAYLITSKEIKKGYSFNLYAHPCLYKDTHVY